MSNSNFLSSTLFSYSSDPQGQISSSDFVQHYIITALTLQKLLPKHLKRAVTTLSIIKQTIFTIVMPIESEHAPSLHYFRKPNASNVGVDVHQTLIEDLLPMSQGL